jgi:predicted metalloprotease
VRSLSQALRAFASVAAIAVLASSCAQESSSGVVVARPRPTTTVAPDSPPISPPDTKAPPGGSTTIPRTSTTSDPAAAGDYHDLVAAAIDDLSAFWGKAFPDTYGRPYKGLRGGVIAATRRSTNIPSCGGQGGTYRDVQENASYCGDGQDYIVYDDQILAPDLAEKFGPASMAVVIAHEWGHAIQFRANVNERSIIMEQQADCFAGSWTAHAINDRPPGVTVATDDINGILAAMISVSDTKGTSATDGQAHGSGFDRVSAFQEGFTQGPKACAKYPSSPPVVIELPFQDAVDQDLEGNLPYPDAIEAMTKDLDLFFAEEFTGWTNLAASAVAFRGAAPSGCAVERAAFCKAKGVIAYDDIFMQSKAYKIGDFAVGSQLAGAWAEAALQREGSTLTGPARSLRADCYVGGWTKAQLPKPTPRQRPTTSSSPSTTVDPKKRTLILSPGDLDEGVVATLRYRTADDAPPFDRIAAFRKGLLGGRAACT